MNKLTTLLSALSLIGVCVLFGLHFSKDQPKNTPLPKTETVGDKPFQARLAYVDIDSFEAHYDFLKAKKTEFEKKQKAIEEELIRGETQLNNEATALQKKAQAGQLSQSEGEAAQKRLMQMSQNLQKKKDNYTEKLYNEQNEFNNTLRKDLTDFLAEYNADKGFDYILSQGPGSTILWADSALNITQDVIKGMNEKKKSNSSPTSGADSTGK